MFSRYGNENKTYNFPHCIDFIYGGVGINFRLSVDYRDANNHYDQTGKRAVNFSYAYSDYHCKRHRAAVTQHRRCSGRGKTISGRYQCQGDCDCTGFLRQVCAAGTRRRRFRLDNQR